MIDRFMFRIWDKKSEDWVESMSMCDFGFPTMQDGTDIEDSGFSEEDLVIEQCTGLKDKNGILIYEGDIVKYEKDVSKVKWCINGFAIDDGINYLVEDMDIEVIGNIHENGDLL